MMTGRYLKINGKKELVNTLVTSDKAFGSISLVKALDGAHYLVRDNFTAGHKPAIAYIKPEEVQGFLEEIEEGCIEAADLRLQLQH